MATVNIELTDKSAKTAEALNAEINSLNVIMSRIKGVLARPGFLLELTDEEQDGVAEAIKMCRSGSHWLNDLQEKKTPEFSE